MNNYTPPYKITSKILKLSIENSSIEYWFARDLQKVLGYERWENFANVIQKAKTACENSSIKISDHFRDVTKMVSIGLNTQRPIEDIMLTRYACYLVAQNGDSKKDDKTKCFAKK
ncbi:MAG: BRO family protein [Sulfurimonas sp.]|uniref:BRO family protein n=1 Tax=Sulfurimonas sp. TaxID=2022749 RepID=UPI0026241715|nr:BRO family protein [Sulfurimonas sp.]MDD3477099.1 BRO family protein [Sulfurimonas sp.]